MKEYIYLDADMLNSALAQLDSGLTKRFFEEDVKQEESSSIESEKTSKGIDSFFKIGAKYVKDIAEETGNNLTTGQSKAIDYVLNDYAVDLLLSKFESLDKFKIDIVSAKEGDIVNFSTRFNVYDFDLIQKTTAGEAIEFMTYTDELQKAEAEKDKILESVNNSISNKDVKKLKKKKEKILQSDSAQAIQGFKMINTVAKYGNAVLGNSILVSGTNCIFLCKKELFRLNQGQLSLLPESSRHINILGSVTGIRSISHNENAVANFKPNELNKVPSILSSILLTEFNLAKEGD